MGKGDVLDTFGGRGDKHRNLERFIMHHMRSQTSHLSKRRCRQG